MKNLTRMILMALLLAALVLAYVLFIRWQDRPPEAPAAPDAVSVAPAIRP